jgi:hypothetical protein
MKIYKNVNFNLDKNMICHTYNSEEYDRTPIYCLYLKLLKNKIDNVKLYNVYQKLNKYKLEEMIVHKDSLLNTRIHM